MGFDLAEFGVDLTARAAAGRLDPVVGRDHEIARVVRVLARKTKNNPLLLGEPGVGKTAIAEGLAARMVAGAVPLELRACTLFSLNLGSLLAGTGYRGDFEQRLRDLVAHLRRGTCRRILFIDELHLLGRAGKSEGGIDAGNLLKPLLARGELPCLGASTPAEWAELVQRDPALERRFQPIEIGEPTPEQARVMLGALREQLERHHHVEITDDAVMAAITWSASSGLDRRLPDRAVDWLDEACAMVRLRGDVPPSPEWAGVRAELAVAEAAFDLYTVARIRSRVLPGLETAVRPLVDAAAVAAVRPEPYSERPLPDR